MTPERAKELLPVIQAYAEGKTIQVKAVKIWVDIESNLLLLNGGYAYRIKPEKKKLKGWIIIPKNPSCLPLFFPSEEKAKIYIKSFFYKNAVYAIKEIEIEYEEGEGLE